MEPDKLLIKCIKITQKLNLTYSQKAEYYMYHKEACLRKIPKKNQNKIMEVLKMSKTLFQQHTEDAMKTGEKNGKKEERENIINAFRENGASEKLIQNVLNQLKPV